jgi:hypothetical protein
VARVSREERGEHTSDRPDVGAPGTGIVTIGERTHPDEWPPAGVEEHIGTVEAAERDAEVVEVGDRAGQGRRQAGGFFGAEARDGFERSDVAPLVDKQSGVAHVDTITHEKS